MQNIDKAYLESIQEVPRQLASTFEILATQYTLDMTRSDVTEAIILRLKAYYNSQNTIKQLLDKRYATAGADFFVETVLFFIKLYLRQNAPGLKAVSEEEILLNRYRNEKGKIRREVLRPDITLYKGEEVIYTIECKTQLGRSRATWGKEYNDRKQKLKQKYQNAKPFLLVMTEDNWGGFGDDLKVGTEYFALLRNKVWPTNYNNSSQIRTGIEGLLKQMI